MPTSAATARQEGVPQGPRRLRYPPTRHRRAPVGLGHGPAGVGRPSSTAALLTWLDLRRSPTRRELFEPLVDAVRSSPEMPDNVDDPIPPLRWLLGELAQGQPLTQGRQARTGLRSGCGRPLRLVEHRSARSPRSEAELYDLHQVRHLAQRLGWARRSGRKLVLTAKGGATRNDGELWRTAARGLLSKHAFAAALGELTLALLASRETCRRPRSTPCSPRWSTRSADARSTPGCRPTPTKSDGRGTRPRTCCGP